MAAMKQDVETVLQSARPHRARRWRYLALVLTAGLVAGGWYWTKIASQDGQPVYVTVPVVSGGLVVTVTATGTVEPTNLVEISSELSGTVQDVLVRNNDRVSAGQVLARLDTDKLQAALTHSRATVEARIARVAEADATVAETHAQLDRVSELYLRNAASAQTVQAAQAAHARADAAAAVARADQKVAEADLAMDEANLSKACICSPINGLVLSRNVEVGQIVASSFQAPVLFTIAEDLSHMELRVDIDEADVGAVAVGQTADFTVEAYQGRSFPAKISELLFAPQTTNGVVTYQAILSIDNSSLMLRPGMTATAVIVVDKIDDTLLVPNGAFRFAPPVVEDDEESASGLLGLLMPRPHAAGTTRRVTPESGDGSRTLWVLRDRVAEAVRVQSVATDGVNTAIEPGALTVSDLIITDMATD